MKGLVELRIKRVTQSKHSPKAYVVLLEHIEGTSRAPIVIGALDAQALLLALQPHLKQARPVTHDLFVNFIRLSGLKLKHMVIEKNLKNVFYSSLHFMVTENESRVMDARTSDALNLCVRYGASIYMNRDLWDECMLRFDEYTQQRTIASTEAQPTLRSLAELEQMLNKAVEKEDFEAAAKLRDLINNMKDNTDE